MKSLRRLLCGALLSPVLSVTAAVQAPVEENELLLLGSGASEGMPSFYCVCDFCEEARKAGGRNERLRTAFQLGESIRIDWGPDALAQAQRFRLKPWKLKHVFITHSHEDHLFPMDFWVRGVSQLPKESELCLYGNREVLDAVGRMIGNQWEKNRIRPILMTPGQRVTLPESGIEVTALAAKHTHPEQSLMYLFDRSGEWRLLITGDTEVFPESSWEALRGAKLTAMTIDATWGMEDRLESHLGIPNIVRIAARLREIGAIDDATRIVPVHFAPGKGARLHGELEQVLKVLGMEPGFDGKRIKLKTK